MAELITKTDFQVLDWIQANLRTPWLDWLMPKITFLCESGWLWIAIALLCLFWKKHRRCGINMALGLIFCGVFGNLLLKHLAARSRPCWINTNIDMLVRIPTDYSFPSGHSLAAFETAIAILLYNRKAGIPAVLVAATVAFSRLYLYVHYPTDVIAGVLLGSLFAVVAWFLINRLLFAKVPALGDWSFIKWKRIREEK